MALTLFFIAVTVFALLEAHVDAHTIREGKPIDHKLEWIGRATFATAACLLLIWWSAAPWWKVIPMLIGGASLFATVHRYALNKARGLHWWYISPSNEYDWQFLRLTWKPLDRTELVEAWHVYMAGMSTKRAATIAYIAEVVVTAICLVLVL